MKKIFSPHKRPKDHFENTINTILTESKLKFDDLNFEKTNTDILKSFNQLNKELKQKPNYISSIQSVISSFDFNLILKPLYTVILTTIVIVAVIELKETNGVKYAEISVEQGEKIKLYVAEEVQIWVNSGSNIKIPLHIKRNPKIMLDGEAFFKITKQSGKPIKIISKDLEFTAVNASFNINSANEELLATIKNGQVKVQNPDLPKSTRLELGEEDQLVFNSLFQFLAVEKESSLNYLAWHTGKLEFNQTPMYEVVETISEIYEVPIVIVDQKINTSDFNAQFENADIDEILDKIQSTFNCEISGDGSKIIIN